MKHLLLFMGIAIQLFSQPLFTQSAADSLTAALNALAEKGDLPGFAIGIVTERGTVYQQGFGLANKDTQRPFEPGSALHTGSVTKTFVGVAIIQQVEAGNLQLDDPITQHLPFEIINPHFPDEPITVRQLVTHTSGLLDPKTYGESYLLASPDQIANDGEHWGYYDFLKKHESMSLHQFLQFTYVKGGKWYKKKNFLKVPAGTQQEYTNLNAALAGLIVEEVSGLPFDQYVIDNIFTPLEMDHSGWIGETDQVSGYFPAGYRVPAFRLVTYPDGGIVSTTEDLCKYLNHMMRGYNGEAGILSQAGFKMLLPGDSDESRAFWGMNETLRWIGHTGSDPGTHLELRFHADQGIGRVILTNVNAEDSEELWNQILEINELLGKYEERI